MKQIDIKAYADLRNIKNEHVCHINKNGLCSIQNECKYFYEFTPIVPIRILNI